MLVVIEQNPTICKEIMEKCASDSGLNFKVDYPFEWNQSISSGGNNINTFYNSGQRSHIKKIYWSTYPTGATYNLIYDKSDLAAAKITQFQTFINGIAVQQFSFVPLNGDDYLYMREKLRESNILSFNEYLYNWCWVEDFLGDDKEFIKTLYPDLPEENLIDDLPLVGQVTYQVISISATNLTNYFFTIFQRQVRINKAGISIM